MHKNYLSLSVSSSLFFYPNSPFEVKKQIQSKYCGHDNISAYFLKVAIDILTVPLTALFNFSLKYGIFPDCLKAVKIIPIFKQGDKLEVSNYRPIFILTAFSKILEKLLCKKTHSFLNKHSIIVPTHYGFRPSCSTICMLCLMF